MTESRAKAWMAAAAWSCALVLGSGGLLAQPLSQTRRANITGGGGSGKCTIEVEVDGVAEVEVSGDSGRIRTLSGQPAVWRRFQCNQVMPRNPGDFRFRGIDGRGRVELVRDPRGGGGRAVVRIEDPKGGREGYTFDLEWRGGDNGGGWERPGRPGGGYPSDRAVRLCEESVISRLNQDGYSDIRFEGTSNGGDGRDDRIAGIARARRGRDRDTRFSFVCSVDSRSGRVRSVEVQRR